MTEATGGAELAIISRIKSAWNKWRQLPCIMKHRNIPLSLKVRVYKAFIRLVLMNGSEMWALLIEDVKVIERTDENDMMDEWIASERKNAELRNPERDKKKSIQVRKNLGRLGW